jgi:hypothetical protein
MGHAWPQGPSRDSVYSFIDVNINIVTTTYTMAASSSAPYVMPIDTVESYETHFTCGVCYETKPSGEATVLARCGKWRDAASK